MIPQSTFNLSFSVNGQSWSGEIPMKATDEPLYEYACHEGNYAMHDILSGARADEAAAAKGKEKK